MGKPNKQKNVQLTMKQTVKVPWKAGGKYAVKLKKKKITVPYELRTKAGQSMYGWDTMQGGCLASRKGIVIMDDEFRFVRWFSTPADESHHIAGMVCADGQIIVGRSPRPGYGQTWEKIDVYRWDGEKERSINIMKAWELENLYVYRGHLYAGMYASHYRTFTKNVRKTITIRGKLKKKKRKKIWKKVKYVRYVRDNYIYRVDGL
ncbi:MAG: hypothetical protein PUB39_01820 [Eubacteriales bacterium]|nr:hypothetical protein [Eubacteriales bacterium]